MNVSAIVEEDLRQKLELLYSTDNLALAESKMVANLADQALQDVDALLQDLEGFQVELESALEEVREDFSELTVSQHHVFQVFNLAHVTITTTTGH